MTNVITTLEQVSAEWLSDVLTRNGALSTGKVQDFTTCAGHGNWSSSASLVISYSKDATGSLPVRLFLKLVDADLDEGEYFGDSEVTYYTRDYVGVRNAPLLRCYDAAYSPESHRYHVLLDDVSESHIEAADINPNLEYGLALAEALAVLHARWWGEEHLVEINAPIHDARFIQNFVDIAAPGVDPILQNFSKALQPHWPATLQGIFARHPQLLIKRAKDLNGFTLIHGDAGHGNILVPRNGYRPIYIIDRQPFNWSLTTWLGVYDLAYAIVLDWNIDFRRECEIPMLRYYHENLLQNGARDYSWQQLYDDYRLCVGMCAYIATEYCRGGVNKDWVHVWLPMLQRALTAYDDLDCYDLIAF